MNNGEMELKRVVATRPVAIAADALGRGFQLYRGVRNAAYYRFVDALSVYYS